jgi:hypothetical protein
MRVHIFRLGPGLNRSQVIGHVSALIVVTMQLIGCADSKTSPGSASGSASQKSEGPGSQTGLGSAPPSFCTEIQPTRATAVATRLVSTDSGKFIVVDLATGPDSSIYILDDKEMRIMRLSVTGDTIASITPDGGGPFIAPAALTVDGEGFIHVADGATIRTLDSSGRQISSTPAPLSAAAIALDAKGDFVIADWVSPRNNRPRPYAAVVYRGSKRWESVAMFTPQRDGKRPFIAPVVNILGLAHGGGRVGMWYAFDRYVEIIEKSEVSTVIKGCLDPAIEARATLPKKTSRLLSDKWIVPGC